VAGVIDVLAAIGAGSTLTLIALVAWLTYRLVGAMREQLGARDLLDKEREELRHVRGDLDTETAAHAVDTKRLVIADNLRFVAEAQRNEALRRVTELLRQHMRTATDDEIRALTDEAFSSPLSVVPSPVPRSQDGDDALLDPFADVRPADVAT
jgi:hypothetical protein